MTDNQPLSRREREIMDIVYRMGRATAEEVRSNMAKPPTNAAARATLRTLIKKGLLRVEQDGPRYVYHPTVPRDDARRSALRHLVDTFFAGSAPGAMAALLEIDETEGLDDKARDRLRTLIEKSVREGR